MSELEWQYSSTQRRHYVDDGEVYGVNNQALFEIKDCAPYGAVHRREHGYQLFHKGGHVQHSKTVKILKMVARARTDL